MSLSYCIRIAERGRWLGLVFAQQDTGERVDGVKLVTEAPEFLGMLDPAKPLLRAGIVPSGANSGRVVLGVDDSGQVRLVACPDKADDAELAGVIADILATSGRFWRQPYSALADVFQEQLGEPLENRVGGRVGAGWDDEAFRNGIAESLQNGRFPVTVLTNDSGEPLQAMLDYLKNMNVEVTMLGYRHARGEGIEMIIPAAVEQPEESEAEEQPARTAGRRLRKPSQQAVPGQVEHGEQHTPTVNFSTRKNRAAAGSQGPFPVEGASPEQRRVLGSLAQLDEIGLVRRGLEYFAPGFERRESAEGTVVVAVDGNRWPFPKSNEVVVVVRTGADHLAGYLRLAREEIEEFLDSLPRVQRKEHRGAMLLRAATVQEADQLVNELRALKEVADTGV